MSESTYNACCDTFDTHTRACVADARRVSERVGAGRQEPIRDTTASDLQNAEMPTDPRTRGRQGNAEAMSAVDICIRIEQIRNHLDAAINLVPAREPWCLLDRIDRDLRQLKKDIGHPTAGL